MFLLSDGTVAVIVVLEPKLGNSASTLRRLESTGVNFTVAPSAKRSPVTVTTVSELRPSAGAPL